MKKNKQFKTLSDKATDFIMKNESKIANETNMAVFSKAEKEKLRMVFHEIAGKPAPTNCAGLCPNSLKLVQNWIRWNNIHNVPTIEEMAEPVELSKLTKKELSEMYPTVSTKQTKAEMINEINGEEKAN